MNNEQALVPVEQKTVEFYGDELQGLVVITHDRERTVYVPVRPLCDFLEVGWTGQRRRINRDPVLAEEMRQVEIQTSGGPQVTQCLPLEYLNGWLFGINADRVRPDIRDRLIRYQRECYKILSAAFTEPPLPVEISSGALVLMQIRETALAVAKLAEEQLAIMQRLDNAAIVIGDVRKRVTALEQQLAPRNAITDEQSADVANKVQALAMYLTEQDKGKNHFQAIYAELHRRFRVSSYKTIRQEQYQAVVDFLDRWANAAAKG